MLGESTHDWREVVTAPDRERLRDWRKTFVDALAAARTAGHSTEIDREGVMLEPDAALAGPAIPIGNYRCRVIKLGAQGTGLLDYVAYPGFSCRVSPQGGLQLLRKLTGSQREVGIVFPGDPIREVFLGTLVLGDEHGGLQYGLDAQRDIAGYLERIGAQRWRLVMPKPHFESQLDVLELFPAEG
jgi:hypothetical protein